MYANTVSSSSRNRRFCQFVAAENTEFFPFPIQRRLHHRIHKQSWREGLRALAVYPQSQCRRTLKTAGAMLFIVCFLATPAPGQWMGKQTGCYADKIAAIPNRPTVSNTAQVTQYGVLEIEYGWDRMWPE